MDNILAPADAPVDGDASAGGSAVNHGLSAPAGLAGLKARRRALRAESARLGIAAQRLEAANEAQRAAVADCEALVALESARMLTWASSGAVGDPPAPDRAAHDRLAAALARAAQSAAAAKSACAGIAERQAEIAAELRTIDAQIEGVALDVLAAEHSKAVILANRATASAAALIGEAHSFKLFLIDRAKRLQTGGDHDAGIALYRRVEKLGSPKPLMGLDDIGMNAAARMWADRYSEMISDE